ncbi:MULTISPECIES: ribbon-helix-helix protein, CopG family [Xanthomonas]|uniref:ribbon-helix-helix protein, CopG family n=1 Tax=Xanthomonas TaxID=338 RepID=UPI001ADC649D|nr:MULTISPECIES: ribbon-helix-helix protein, CopG family [unclassified Xanthomonas]MBO9875457.1 ribbon-helix-helix protein, CopG family [Xanthomonas sp. D-93]WNH44236.1 ribbon-helix-helix protein, CopG family [Xanthomonas sp. A6251]
MSTTTIRLPDALKARVAKAAEAAGTTSHNFILEAIAEKAELAERRVDSIPWDEMRRYLMERSEGKDTPPPAPRRFAK